jgi:hypothetical protein
MKYVFLNSAITTCYRDEMAQEFADMLGKTVDLMQVGKEVE